jgi:hypothetical protein
MPLVIEWHFHFMCKNANIVEIEGAKSRPYEAKHFIAIPWSSFLRHSDCRFFVRASRFLSPATDFRDA